MIENSRALDSHASLGDSTMSTTTQIKIESPIRLENTAQKYPWGKIGEQSLVAQLLPDFDKAAPYAELWVGAHPKSPSLANVGDSVVPLDRLIAEKPVEILGKRVYEKFGATLPFLFKILSVNQALSIQAHPDKNLAKNLHRNKPEHYPDDNHKPEVSIPLTELKLLYGFRVLSEIRELASATPEFATLLGDKLIARLSENTGAEDKTLLKDLYTAVIRSDSQQRTELSEKLGQRLAQSSTRSETEELFLDLTKQYGSGDVGLFSIYLMNICTAKPGEAVFIGPNIPHAYLSGDLVECMANSDNVVRAGLTPKYQDADTLTAMLTYESGPVRTISSRSEQGSPLASYQIPVQEFKISEIQAGREFSQQLNGEPLLAFCLQGELRISSNGVESIYHKGEAVILPANLAEVSVKTQENSRNYLVAIP